MKKFFKLFVVSLLFFSSQTIFTSNLFAASPNICRVVDTLRVGSLGDQVKCLQAIIGAKVDGHFGPLTKASVVAFQSKNGLSTDGVAGPLTRAALSRAVASNNANPNANNTSNNNTNSKNPVNSSISTIPGTNLNINVQMPDSLKDPQKNLEDYITVEKEGLAKRGESPATISAVEEEIRRSTRENPNMLQQFFDSQKVFYNKTGLNSVPSPRTLSFFKKATSFIKDALFPNKANASGNLPFGGFIVYANSSVCDCIPGLVTQVKVALPSAPKGISNMVLNYLNGTQAFLNYNMPEVGIATVGLYTPGVLSCLKRVGYYCVPMYAEGQITPVVGSSLE